MPENLWVVRRRKKMNVRELAARSGIRAELIHRYEAGEMPVPEKHLKNLARALMVDPGEIKMVSEPKPRTGARQGPPREREKPAAPPKPKAPRPVSPARPTQISHLLKLSARFPDVDQASLEAEAGKPLEQLNRQEAAQLISRLEQRIIQERPPKAPAPPYERRRAHLPEGVDEFEMKYLAAAQEAGHTLELTLFDGTTFRGQVVGFGPYNITIRQENGDEVTVQKLALAYYRRPAGES